MRRRSFSNSSSSLLASFSAFFCSFCDRRTFAQLFLLMISSNAYFHMLICSPVQSIECTPVCLSVYPLFSVYLFNVFCLYAHLFVHHRYAGDKNFNLVIFLKFFKVICPSSNLNTTSICFFCTRTSVHLLKFLFIHPGHLPACHTAILIIHLYFFFCILVYVLFFFFLSSGSSVVHLSIL
jgi:hypothetical protein